MIYPKRIQRDENIHLCHLMNTTLPIPIDNMDNQLLYTEVGLLKNNCSFPKLMVWLGILRDTWSGEWLNTYTKTPVTYSNFHSQLQKEEASYFCGYISNDGVWEDAFCSYPRCGACLLRRSDFLTMRGLCFGNRLETHFYPRGYKGGMPMFHSFSGYVIFWVEDRSQWRLYNSATKQKIASLTDSKTLVPFGVRQWKAHTKMCDFTDMNLYISLSSCGDDMFTCTSGPCIELQKRCNYVFDCEDGSDEDDCGLVNIPKAYVQYLPPRGPRNSPLPLTPIVTLVRVAHVDIINMVIDVEFVVSITWRDDRLSFQHLSTSRKKFISEETVTRLWMPQFQISNLVDAKFKLLDNVVIISTSEGAQLPVFNSIKRGKFLAHQHICHNFAHILLFQVSSMKTSYKKKVNYESHHFRQRNFGLTPPTFIGGEVIAYRTYVYIRYK